MPTGGYNLTAIRQFAAREAGKFVVSASGAASSVSELLDPNWPVASQVQGSTTYKDYWLFRSLAALASDAMRLVKTYNGNASGGAGALDPDLPWTNAPANGETYELHGMFPPAGTMPDAWTTLINDGLKQCSIPVEFTFSPVNDTNTRHPLATAAPWLTNPRAIRRVGFLPANSQGRDILDPYSRSSMRGGAEIDGTSVYLEIGAWPSSGTVYVTALKPAYYHCAPAVGAFGAQYGLSLESDVAPVDSVEWAAYAALIEGWRRFAQVLDTSVAGRAINSLQQAVAQFDKFNPDYSQHFPEFKQMQHWGPIP